MKRWNRLTVDQQIEYVEKLKYMMGDEPLLCTKTWDAWSVGTMVKEDFISACEDEAFMYDFASKHYDFIREYYDYYSFRRKFFKKTSEKFYSFISGLALIVDGLILVFSLGFIHGDISKKWRDFYVKESNKRSRARFNKNSKLDKLAHDKYFEEISKIGSAVEESIEEENK